jgi:large subunit ribosomal protein L3
MGGKWRSLMGLKIWRINHKYNILYVNGPVMPGPTHCYVRVTDSCIPAHRQLITKDNHPPFPTFYMDDTDAAKQLPEEEFAKDLHNFSEPSIMFENFEVKKFVKRDGAKLAKIKN